MSLTLCSTCRLPVNTAVESCPLCTAPMPRAVRADRRVPLAAAIAMVATVTMLTRRRA